MDLPRLRASVGAQAQTPLDANVDANLDALLEEELGTPLQNTDVSDAGLLEQVAAEVEETTGELHFLDTGVDAGTTGPGAIARAVPANADDLDGAQDELVSYSEPAIAPSPDRRFRPTPSGSLRVPDIPDLDLHVASALESVAQRIRAGELHLPPLQGAGDDASSLALALAALLATRH